MKDKERAKLEAEVADACARNGRHRQLIGVSAVRIFDARGAFCIGGGEGVVAGAGSEPEWKRLETKDGRPVRSLIHLLCSCRLHIG